MKSKYLEYGGKLALICIACMFGVAGAYVSAMERIAEGKQAALTGAIAAVVDADPSAKIPEQDGIFVSRERQGAGLAEKSGVLEPARGKGLLDQLAPHGREPGDLLGRLIGLPGFVGVHPEGQQALLPQRLDHS